MCPIQIPSKEIVLANLYELLQKAIKIEHSTMPAYCYALWSLKDPNSQMAGVIRSVVREEMLHMAMACNILNAIGGSPRINDKENIPLYPCTPPGHTEHEHPLVVHLDKLSLGSISTFIHIELPHERKQEWIDTCDDGWSTIGEFYMDLERHLAWLPETMFGHGRQCLHNSTPHNSGILIEVNSKAAAMLAIKEIMIQGEGIDLGPLPDHLKSHYELFKDIYGEMGGTATVDITNFDQDALEQNYDAQKYEEFQKNVRNVVRDPIQNNCQSEQLILANRHFNSSYSRMLDSMQKTFNSDSPDITEAAEHMFAMERWARTVMSIPVDPTDLSRGYCGPTFEYLPLKDRSQF